MIKYHETINLYLPTIIHKNHCYQLSKLSIINIAMILVAHYLRPVQYQIYFMQTTGRSDSKGEGWFFNEVFTVATKNQNLEGLLVCQ